MVGGALKEYRPDLHPLGPILGVFGLGILAICLGILVIAASKGIARRGAAVLHDKGQSKAYEDLLRYKKLLDEKLISRDEFDSKSRELKAKLL